MEYRLYEERLKYLVELAARGRLLSLQQVANKFDCSVPTVVRMIRHLKSNGHQIQYSRALRKFIYQNNE